MASTRKHYTRLRRRLFEEQNALCYWCKEAMDLPEVYAPRHPMKPNSCTLDHLRDKTSPHRHTQGAGMHVVACYQCNTDRGRASQTYLKETGEPAIWRSKTGKL
jgi:hypothetical protein